MRDSFYLYTGSDITIVSHSLGVGLAVDAAHELAKQGIKAEVSRPLSLSIGHQSTVHPTPRYRNNHHIPQKDKPPHHR